MNRITYDQSNNIVEQVEKKYYVPFLTDDLIRWGLIIGVIALFVIGYIFHIRYNQSVKIAGVQNLAKISAPSLIPTINTTTNMSPSPSPSTIAGSTKLINKLNVIDQMNFISQ
jgi:hypothetical protein